jgi:hypothetical protein
MADFVTQAVRRLRADPGFSRNRYYLALSSPEGRRALRIHRHLRSLERDLARGASATLTADGGRFRLSLRGRLGRREAWLTRTELRLLLAGPAAAAIPAVALEGT